MVVDPSTFGQRRIADGVPAPYSVTMIKLLDSVSYWVFVPAAALLALAPFRPEPHLVEKVRMLVQGTLSKPIDIFDLLLHATPLILLIVKIVADLVRRRA